MFDKSYGASLWLMLGAIVASAFAFGFILGALIF